MKMSVITGRGGKILGTARHTEGEGHTAAGSGGPVAGPGQTIHLIEVPSDLREVSPDELFVKLKRLIPAGTKKPKKGSSPPKRK